MTDSDTPPSLPPPPSGPPPASSLPPPDAFMPAPTANRPGGLLYFDVEIPFNPFFWWRQLRQAFADGPLWKRIYRGGMGWAITIALLGLLSQAGGLALIFSMDTTNPFASDFGFIFAAGVGASCLGALLWLFYVFSPIFYGQWAHRKYYVNDPMLRSSPIGPPIRLRAICAAAVMLAATAVGPTIVLTPITMPLSAIGSSAGIDLSALTIVLACVGGFFAVFGTMASILFFFLAVTIRMLTLDSVTGRNLGRTWVSVLLLYLAALGAYIAATCAGSAVVVPVYMIVAFQQINVAPGGGAPPVMISDGLFAIQYASQILIGTLMPLAVYWVCWKFWQRDVPIALELYADSAEPE